MSNVWYILNMQFQSSRLLKFSELHSIKWFIYYAKLHFHNQQLLLLLSYTLVTCSKLFSILQALCTVNNSLLSLPKIFLHSMSRFRNFDISHKVSIIFFYFYQHVFPLHILYLCLAFQSTHIKILSKFLPHSVYHLHLLPRHTLLFPSQAPSVQMATIHPSYSFLRSFHYGLQQFTTSFDSLSDHLSSDLTPSDHPPCQDLISTDPSDQISPSGLPTPSLTPFHILSL